MAIAYSVCGHSHCCISWSILHQNWHRRKNPEGWSCQVAYFF